MKLIDNQHTRLLAKAMDVYSLRQKMTASNIANIDTPGYNRASVSFEEELQRVEELSIDSRELSSVNPTVTEHDEKPILEDELLEMSDTQMRVQLVTRALRHNYEIMRTGITGRNR
ncbi:flagellar basal body rod protein FlgB [Fodinibius sediminis]|uniref:Flagellar basal body rod protein FlgB n=1 Tax=Fodinibius sediminis TaxID=1214077 RepID=A0A521CJ37_9BACT|nr:flagellar basal body rod protein FlgB [Fodinibius sediminis]SMO59473.1 flagellar basal-body rod protein FlgB [Fodinibius sediminis]